MKRPNNPNYDEDLNELLRRAHLESRRETEDSELGYTSEDDTYGDFQEEVYVQEDSVSVPHLGLSASEKQEVVEAWERFRKHYTHERLFFAFFCLLLVIAVSSWNTYYKEQIHSVATKEKRMTDLRNRELITTAELVGLERINNIENNIQLFGLDLEHSAQPPYMLRDKTASQENK